MIKIAHVAKPVAGVGVYINLLSKHIDNNKFKNIILCNVSEDKTKAVDNNGDLLETYDIKIIREINLYYDIKSLIYIINILKKNKPDIIHCHSAKAGILGRIAGCFLRIPTLYTPHAYSYLSAKNKLKKRVFKNIERIFKWFPAKTLSCSLSEYNRTINDLGFKKEKVLLWNNSIENKFKLKKTDIELPESFICSIGRLSYQKNTTLLINSFNEFNKIFSNVHLVILGIGHYSPELKLIKELIDKLNLQDKVILIPWLIREETLTILKKSKLYISTSRYEGLPYATIEALALAKACIVTNVDGNKDLVINDINGYALHQDSKIISKKIISLFNDGKLREKMEIESRKKFEKEFLIEKNILLLEDIYSKIN